MFGMKGNLLIFCFIALACIATSALGGIISSPSELMSVTPGEDVIINNGGIYSLHDLDSVGANTIKIDFGLGGGGSNPNMLLVANSDFDGTLNVPLTNFIDNLQIRLMDDFLNNVSGTEILHFTSITNTSGVINVFEETDSGMYVYNWATCSGGTGICVIRSYSDSYNAAISASQHEQQVRAVGVQNNPKMLLRPMTTIHQHELLGLYEFSDDLSVSVAPEYYAAKNFHNLGLKLNSGTKIGGRLSVAFGAYVSKADFHNDVSEFESDVYGGNLRFYYNIDEMLFLRGVGGVSYASIDCDGIKNGDGVKNNPGAYGFYAGMDFGTKINFESGLFISPFIGYATQYEKVVDANQKDSFVHVGGDVGFKYFMDGVTYSYMLRAGINTQGYFDGSAGVGIWTVSDKIGGSISLGLLNTDFGWSGKVAADIKFAF